MKEQKYQLQSENERYLLVSQERKSRRCLKCAEQASNTSRDFLQITGLVTEYINTK